MEVGEACRFDPRLAKSKERCWHWQENKVKVTRKKSKVKSQKIGVDIDKKIDIDKETKLRQQEGRIIQDIHFLIDAKLAIYQDFF